MSNLLAPAPALAWVLLVCGLCPLSAGDDGASESDPKAVAPPAEEALPEAPPVELPSSANERTALNLLGEVDSQSGEARRNENVQLTLINNNVLKELNTRMGTTATIIKQFDVENTYFGDEFGGSPSPSLHLPPSRGGAFHGNVFWSHSNSATSARSFFQVGKVQPARTNDYGFNLTTPLGKRTFLTVDGSQRRLRGQVNGNVLVPAADERIPTTTDPTKLRIVEAVLGAFGAELPNRTDINPRALNTNSPQNIDNDRGAILLEHDPGDDDRLVLRYNVTLQDVEAFQLVGGQNPDTTTKNHQARLTWTRAWSPSTTTDLSAGFDRVGSLLVPEETSLGSFYLFSRLMDSIGPNDNIPINRAQNSFRYAGRLRSVRGNHAWTTGFALLRRQINGFESNGHRGTYSFRNDFGRNVAENLLAGTPSSFRRAIGDVHRGFRNWDLQFYVGDDWRVGSKLSINWGLRYEPAAKPSEVRNLAEIPYGCDCNNFAPRFGFAYKANDRWGVFRGAYGIQYGEIFPATFMATRFNPPQVVTIANNAPDLADPLAGVDIDHIDPNTRSVLLRLDPELSTPYSHQYNFTWEMRPVKDWVLELGYVGSRSPKLLQAWYLNRARRVEGIEHITQTINERRPDSRYADVIHTLNGSRGYYDAAKLSLRLPHWAGLSLEASYWFSKAIDLGSNYTNNAFGRDGRQGRAPVQDNVHGTMKGPSDFDQSHAAIWTLSYETPQISSANGWASKLLGQWQLSTVALIKSGTPFTVRSGSDGPGIGNVDGAASDRPNIVDPSILGAAVDYPDTSAQALPAEAFAFHSIDEPSGNLGSNTFRKDGVFNVNAAISRTFSLGGDESLVFQGESLNLTNHPQFAEPGRELSARNFGKIANTLNDGRAFRFTLRFIF